MSELLVSGKRNTVPNAKGQGDMCWSRTARRGSELIVLCVPQVPPFTLPCPDLSWKAGPSSASKHLLTIRWVHGGEGGRRGVGRRLEGGRKGKLGYFSCFCPAGLWLWQRLHFSKATDPAHGCSPLATALPGFQKCCFLTCHSDDPRDRLPILARP